MSDVNSLFKKKKGKSKALDLSAATTTKKPSKTKAEKQKEAAEDDEWKTETKKVYFIYFQIQWVFLALWLVTFSLSMTYPKAVVLTNGKAAEEFG